MSMWINEVSEIMSQSSFLDFNIGKHEEEVQLEHKTAVKVRLWSYLYKFNISLKNSVQAEQNNTNSNKNYSKSKFCNNNEEKIVKKERTPLPVFEWIFWAKSDHNLYHTISHKMYRRFENTIDKLIALDRYSKPTQTNTPKPPNPHSPKTLDLSILQIASTTHIKPTLKFSIPHPKPTSSSPNPQNVKNLKNHQNSKITQNPQKCLFSPSFEPNNQILDHSCIQIRSSPKCMKKIGNISFETDVHNIYDPEYSSSEARSSSHGDGEFSSLEISFEMNDSWEELMVRDSSFYSDKSIKVERVNKFKQRTELVQQEPLEPLFSISPKKDEFLVNNVTKSTRQDSGRIKLIIHF